MMGHARRAILLVAFATVNSVIWVLVLFDPASGQTVNDVRRLPDSARLAYVAGFASGVAVAVAAPDRVAALQKCFNNWQNDQLLAVFDNWIKENPGEWHLT